LIGINNILNSTPMTQPLYKREMIPIIANDVLDECNYTNEESLSVMTYNVLAECYTYEDRYPHCPEFARM
jgi:mRNA deadenylase 3'-5' endonuclease subunit Ccr4